MESLQQLGQKMKESVQHTAHRVKESTTGTSGSSTSVNILPSSIGVILCGYPNSLSIEVAKELNERGVKILLAIEESGSTKWAGEGTKEGEQQQGTGGESWGSKISSFMGGSTSGQQQHEQPQQQQQPQTTQHQGPHSSSGGTTQSQSQTGGTQYQQGGTGETYQKTTVSTTTGGQGYQTVQQAPHQQQQPPQPTHVRVRKSDDPALAGTDVVSCHESGLPTKIHEVTKSAHDRGMHVIGIDVSDNPSSEMFEQCEIPFVMCVGKMQGSYSGFMRTRAAAVIDEDFNRYSRALEEAWEYLGKRFPGLLKKDWRVEGYECKPEHEPDYDRCTERMFESIDKLVGRPVAESSIKKIRDKKEASKNGVPTQYLHNHVATEVKFKNKDDTACFRMETMFAGDRAEAEGIADSAMFLAKKCASGARPRTYKLTDVLEMKLQHKEESERMRQERQEQTAQ